jgi:hypothetical protein
MKLFATGALTMLRPMPFVHAVGFVSPYWTLLVGVACALVAWGLLQVRDWARFTATLMPGIGIAWALSMVITRMHFGWRMLALCLEICIESSSDLVSLIVVCPRYLHRQARPTKTLLGVHRAGR